MSADIVLQTQVFSRLTTQFATDAQTAPITAHPATDQPLPYVRIGEVTNASDHVIGQEFEIQIDVYSRKSGPHEAKSIQKSIRTAFHNLNFDADGFRYTCVRVVFTSSFLDVTDGVWQGVQRIRALAS